MTFKAKLISISFLIAAGIASFLLWNKTASEPSAKNLSNQNLPVIAMTQIIEHHTLDTVRAGLIAELRDKGFDEQSAKIIYENAHGNVATATQIANKFASLQPRILIALSTQSAQILTSLSNSANIPLVFTAVTNPLAAKLVETKTKPKELITGVSDFMDPKPQLEMMRAFVPRLEKLGVLYNPAEINSVSFLKEMEEVAKSMGITLVFAILNNTSEANSATMSLIGKVDAIYFPNDNTAMAAVGAIASTALKHNTPVFANDSASVERGVLAALAYDRFAMGRKTGEIVVAILNGKKPQEIPVVYDTPSEVVINMSTLDSLKLSVPSSLKSVRKI
jgi:putative tryptophan/tyrosine transport system substrate-binding protein